MAYKFEFENYWGHKVDDNLQFSLLKGDTGKVIHRDNVTENVNPDGIVYDSENSKIYKRPNHIISVKGKLEITLNCNFLLFKKSPFKSASKISLFLTKRLPEKFLRLFSLSI